MNQPSELLDRLPPQNLEAEKGLLGSVLLNARVLDDLPRMKPDEFYAQPHRILFRHMQAMHAAGVPVDGLTLVERLKRAGDLQAMGGVAYLAEVAQSVPVAAHAGYYAGIVRRTARLRAIIAAATEMLRTAYAQGADPDEVLAACEAAMGAIETADHEQEPVSAMDAARVMVSHLEAIETRRKSAGCLTGITDFDEQIGGLFPGELAVLAARPSVGKTALALQVAYHVASAGRTCYIASLEMSRVELAVRLTCGRAGVNSRLIRSGKVGPAELELLIAAANEVARAKLWIHDAPGLSVYDVRRAARKIARHGLDLIVIDYLQLLAPADAKAHREQQVARMSRDLKCLARELVVPVLCLCQLNRACEEEGGEPQLRHLRESGAIEQDADMVLFLGRRVSWIERRRGEDRRQWESRLAEERDAADFHTQAKLWLRKNRNGELGTFRLRWSPATTRFEKLASPYDEFKEFA